MKPFTNFKLGCIALAISQLTAAPTHAQTASIIVDSNLDTRAANICTLRAAIIAANTNQNVDSCNPTGVDIDIIDFDNNLLSDSTITLNNELPNVTSNIVINGLGQDKLAISGNNNTRIISVVEGNLTLNNITLTRGNESSGDGGAISTNRATLNINSCTLSNNTSNYSGGGVSSSNNSIIIISNTTLSNNTARFNGGGINLTSGTATINSSTLLNNSVNDGGGGGIASFNNDVTINNSTVSNNNASYGGGISSFDSTIVSSNSTLSSNTGNFFGGGISLYNGLTSISNTIISGNTPIAGNEIDISGVSNTITFTNNIIGTNASFLSDAITGFIPDSTNILATFDQNNIPLNEIIAPLTDNGGPTLTHALAPGSPAIDAGDNSRCISENITTDQRGEARVNSDDDPCDIGAFEAVVQQQETFFTIPLPNGRTVIFGL